MGRVAKCYLMRRLPADGMVPCIEARRRHNATNIEARRTTEPDFLPPLPSDPFHSAESAVSTAGYGRDGVVGSKRCTRC